MSSINSDLETLTAENVRLRQENLQLGKKIMKIAYQQTKKEKQNLGQNKTKSRDKDSDYDRTR